MMIRKTALALIVATMFAAPAFAQSNAATDTQRDVNQQQRIEQGLKSGQLNTKEAGQLERQQQQIDRVEARDLKDGSINAKEQARLNALQNHASEQIKDDKHNAIKGNPESASSERLQNDVQRNVNQQKRIEGGLQSGSLSHREAGSLERGQAHVNGAEAHAAANGNVSAREQGRIQARENRQSSRIYNKKHDGAGK